MLLKEKFNKLAQKAILVAMGAYLALLPSQTFAAGPSTYVNNITNGLYDEAMLIATPLAVCALSICLVAYLAMADDQKKRAVKSSGFAIAGIYLVLLVIEPLLSWFSGLVK